MRFLGQKLYTSIAIVNHYLAKKGEFLGLSALHHNIYDNKNLSFDECHVSMSTRNRRDWQSLLANLQAWFVRRKSFPWFSLKPARPFFLLSTKMNIIGNTISRWAANAFR